MNRAPILAAALVLALAGSAPAVAEGDTPTATISPSPSPTAPFDEGCRPLDIAVAPSPIRFGESSTVTVRTSPDALLWLDAAPGRSPSYTEFRNVRPRETAGEDGVVSWTVRTPETTTLRIGMGYGVCYSYDRVVEVEPHVSISARRTASRSYVFSGRVLPGRGASLALYRVEPGGGRVLTSRSVVRPDGTYEIRRTFTGSGRFGFVVAVARSDRNLAGQSATRPTVVF